MKDHRLATMYIYMYVMYDFYCFQTLAFMYHHHFHLIQVKMNRINVCIFIIKLPLFVKSYIFYIWSLHSAAVT